MINNQQMDYLAMDYPYRIAQDVRATKWKRVSSAIGLVREREYTKIKGNITVPDEQVTCVVTWEPERKDGPCQAYTREGTKIVNDDGNLDFFYPDDAMEACDKFALTQLGKEARQ